MLVRPENQDISVSGGTGTATVGKSNCGAMLKQIKVKATTDTTTFDVSLTDIYGNLQAEWFDQTGELNERDMELLAYGKWTLTVSNATNDETFTYLLVFLER